MVQSKLSGKRSPAPKDEDVEGSDQHDGDVVADCEVSKVKNEIVPISELDGKEERILLLEDGGAPSYIAKVEVGLGWSELEMGLYEKGLQVFGRNRYKISYPNLNQNIPIASCVKFSTGGLSHNPYTLVKRIYIAP